MDKEKKEESKSMPDPEESRQALAGLCVFLASFGTLCLLVPEIPKWIGLSLLGASYAIGAGWLVTVLWCQSRRAEKLEQEQAQLQAVASALRACLVLVACESIKWQKTAELASSGLASQEDLAEAHEAVKSLSLEAPPLELADSLAGIKPGELMAKLASGELAVAPSLSGIALNELADPSQLRFTVLEAEEACARALSLLKESREAKS